MKCFWGLMLAVFALAAVAQPTADIPDAPPDASWMPEGSHLSDLLGDLTPLIDGAATAARDVPEDMPSGTPALRLTVRECVDRAVEENPRLREAEGQVEAAQARVGQARSPLLPQIGAESALTRREDADMLGDGGFLSSLILGDGYQSEDTMRTDRIAVDQVFFAGGSLVAGLRASKHLAEAEEWQRQAATDQLVFETRQAFYDCLLAEALVRVAEDSVAAFDRHEQDIRQMLDVGVVSNFELLRAQTELEARRSNRSAAQNARRLAFANLRRLLALPQDTPIEIVGRLFWKPLDEPVQELVKEALEYRPELRAVREGIGAAEQDVRRVKGSYLPRVGGRAEWTNVDGGGISPEGWAVSVGADWELFTGMRRRYEVAESKATVKSLDAREEDVARLVELEVHRAYILVQDAVAKVRSERAAVELGAEGLRLAMLRFQAGVGTQADTLDAELALTNAERALVQAARDYAVAHAALEKAVGRGRIYLKETSIVEGAPQP
jgi:outer membrane protein TolC